MKKGTIIALCVAGGLVVLGLILGVAAVMMGGDPVELFNNGSYTIYVDGIKIGISSNGSYENGGIPAEPGEVYTVNEEIDKVYIGWVSGSVRVEPSTDGSLSFYEESSLPVSEKDTLFYSVKDGKLSIDWKREQTIIGFNLGIDNPDKHLVVRLPDSVKELMLDCTSADVYVSDFSFDEKLNISTVSGDVAVSDTYARRIRLDTTSGEIGFDGECYEFSYDTVSGDCTFSGVCTEFNGGSTSGDLKAKFSEMPHEIGVDTTSGDVELTLPDKADFELEYDTASGDMDCKHPLSMRDGEYICGSGENEISIDTVSGDLKIK